MAGYTRQRQTEIQNGNVADADDVAAELNQVQSAFSSSTGHRHDGTSAEGPPITVLGPNQQIEADASSVKPSTDAAIDVGTSLLRFKDAYFSGTVTGAVSGNATTATTLQTARTINGTSFNGSANIITANWGTPRTLTLGATGKSVNGSADVSWSLTEIGAADRALTITAGTGLTGGGDLTTNRTIGLSTASQNSLALANTAVQPSDLGTAASQNDDRYAHRANNLSDLSSAATARTNLGLGTAATANSTDFATAAQGVKADNAAPLPGSNGIVVRTGVSTTAPRAIVAGSNITVSNGDGVAGNPVIAATLPSTTGAVGTYASLAFNVPPSSNVNTGETRSGSVLFYTGQQGGNVISTGSSPSGTWQLMGFLSNGNISVTLLQSSVWLRIS
jgi:hypothetical protein